MGVRILFDNGTETGEDRACLFCSTTGWAFGYCFGPDSDTDETARDVADAFLSFLADTDGRDPRRLTDKEMADAVAAFYLARESRREEAERALMLKAAERAVGDDGPL